MIILDFLEKFRCFPAFSLRQVELAYPGFERENLLNWQKKGYIVRIRNGWYTVKGRISTEAHLYWVANKIYAPSYVSLESAFSHYDWIPEAVITVTSVTTRKTQAFDTPVGHFRYSSTKPLLHFGYRLLDVDGYGAKMAEPEKALLDFLYFHPRVADQDAFEALRLNVEQVRNDLNRETLEAYCALFESDALEKRLCTFTKYLYHAETI